MRFEYVDLNSPDISEKCRLPFSADPKAVYVARLDYAGNLTIVTEVYALVTNPADFGCNIPVKNRAGKTLAMRVLDRYTVQEVSEHFLKNLNENEDYSDDIECIIRSLDFEGSQNDEIRNNYVA